MDLADCKNDFAKEGVPHVGTQEFIIGAVSGGVVVLVICMLAGCGGNK